MVQINKASLSELQKIISERYQEYGYTRPTSSDFASRLHLDVSMLYRAALEAGKIDNSLKFVETPIGLAPDSFGTHLADVILLTLWIADTFGIDITSALELRMNYKKSLHVYREKLRARELKISEETAEPSGNGSKEPA